jgi:endonuclease/exonuclease/phosphatase family metal-dependent hydrolase
MSIRLLTQNCYWTRIWNKRKRFKYIKEEIDYFNPDVVCLQEMVFRTDQRHVSLDDLSSHRMKGVWSNKGGLITMVRDDDAEQQIWNKYKHQGAIISWQIAERFMGKGFHAIKLKRNGVWIINTHLSANFSLLEKPQQVQVQQAQEILDFVDNKDEVVLVGDLNITPFSDAYKLLTTVFIDCSSHLSTYPKKAQILDYVLYKGSRYRLSHSTHLRYEHAPFKVSDHFGLVVELTNNLQIDTTNAKSHDELQEKY